MDIVWPSVGAIQRAWLVLSKEDQIGGRGSYTYEDDVASQYFSDSLVPNSRRIQPGDAIVVWDQKRLLGASVVESVVTGAGEKELKKCPQCGEGRRMSRPRKNGPRYRCEACRAEFDDPILSVVPVTTYRTRHDEAWVDLAGELDAVALRGLCESPKSQLSIRSLDWLRFVDALSTDIGRRGVRLFDSVAGQLSGGFTERVTRVRVGQPAFRADLLNRYGPLCAFSGDAPSEVLDAAHLYSYAAIGEHFDEGGLLLRRDLHRLFDLGKLAVRPDSRIVVHNSLKPYPLYARCEGAPLQVSVTDRQRDWFTEHRRQWRVDE